MAHLSLRWTLDTRTKLVSRIETISTGFIDYSKVGYLSDKADVAKYELKTNDFLIQPH